MVVTLLIMWVDPSTNLRQIIITDNDVIEKSNLNRQFLFREKDLGTPKSEAAARAIACINPGVEIRPLTKKAR